MENQVPEDIKADRLLRLQEVLNQQQQDFNESCIGKVLPVLFDRMGKTENQYLGKTPYLQSVHVTSDVSLSGKCVDIFIEKAFANSLTGSVLCK